MPPVPDDVIAKLKKAFESAHSIRAAAKMAGVSFTTAKKYAPAEFGKSEETLPIASLRMDGGTQIRAETKESTIDDYTEAYKAGAEFPPVVVFFDEKDYWLADGFQRAAAALRAGLTEIDVDIRLGTQRDAVLYALGANADHGERRTNADKRRAVEKMLEDEFWRDWSDTEIAKQCKVSRPFVAGIRAGQLVNVDKTNVRKGADGRTRDTSQIGSRTRRKPSIPYSNSAPGSSAALTEGAAASTDPAKPGDPADVAEGRRNGTIPADAVVEVTEPKGPTAGETSAEPPPQTDEEWLATLTERTKLAEHIRKRFDTEALAFRAVSGFRRAFAAACRPITNAAKAAHQGHIGPWMDRHFGYLKMNDPAHWRACGDCSGSGNLPLIGRCPSCHGEGYHVV